MNPTYVLNVNAEGKSPEQVTQALEQLENWDITTDATTTLEVAGSSWIDYIDLGLKALLVIAAFAIYARL